MTTHAITDARGAVDLSEEAVAGLRERLRGPLLGPADPGFAAATELWNAMIDTTPALVVRPTGTADVVEAVRFARDHRLPISVRGGGHNIAGTALVDGGVTLDMSRLRVVTVDPHARVATVAAGCLLGEVDRETQLHGLATPLGFVSEVGVAGLTLGGGLGYLTRRYGWTVDNLLGVEIVTADGQVRHASRERDPDLFWAVRGAGANLGVVTSFTLRLHPVGPLVHGGLVAWPFERAAEIQRAYRRIAAEAPRELSVWLNILRAPAAPFVPERWHGELVVRHVRLLQRRPRHHRRGHGPDPGAGRPRRRPARHPAVHAGAVLSRRHRAEGPALLLEDRVPGRAERRPARPPGEPSPQNARSRMPSSASSTSAGPWPTALPTTGPSATGTPDSLSASSGCGSPTSRARRRFRTWVRDAWRRVRPFSTGGNYVNFQTADEGDDRIRATYGANHDRLVAVKHAYDPDNLFRSNRNIRP